MVQVPGDALLTYLQCTPQYWFEMLFPCVQVRESLLSQYAVEVVLHNSPRTLYRI